MDTYFSNLKNTNLQIIDDGGWHFTNIKTPEELFKKMTNFGHHDEFDLSGLTVEDLKKKIDKKKVFYNHFADKENLNKWSFEYDLTSVDDEMLPKYLTENKHKYKEWFDK